VKRKIVESMSFRILCCEEVNMSIEAICMRLGIIE
jgi:hypothetical protein